MLTFLLMLPLLLFFFFPRRRLRHRHDAFTPRLRHHVEVVAGRTSREGLPIRCFDAACHIIERFRHATLMALPIIAIMLRYADAMLITPIRRWRMSLASRYADADAFATLNHLTPSCHAMRITEYAFAPKMLKVMRV